MWIGFAMSAAVCFGLRGILYHWTSRQGINRNLMLFGVFFTGMIVCLLAGLITNQSWTFEALIGTFMGMFSFATNAAMYRGFAVGKASLIAVLTSLTSLVVVIIAYLAWGETLSAWQFFAFGVILAGVLLIRYSNDLSFKQLQGAQWGALAMLFFGFNDITGKQSTLLGAELFPTLFFMFATGTLLFAVFWMFDKQKSEEAPWPKHKIFFWGMAVGTTNVGRMIMIVLAFRQGVTGLVSAIVALNVLIILLYTRIVLKEKLSRLEWTGAVLSLVGIVVLRIA